MAIIVKLYGDLKGKILQKTNDIGAPSTLNIELIGIKTIFDILRKFNIEENELSHIFVNGKYCGPGKRLQDGDRIGLFPKRMGLIFMEIEQNNTIRIEVKLFADLTQFGPERSRIDLPEGSTTQSILKKYNIPKEKRKLIILVNERPCQENDHVFKNGDVVSIFPPNGGG
ncbi:MAG: MoaD/ThiS family protein [Promethearchaeota archaeon]